MVEVKRFRKIQHKPFVYPPARIWALTALRDFLAFPKGPNGLFFSESFSALRSLSHETSGDVISVTLAHKTKKIGQVTKPKQRLDSQDLPS